MSDLLIEVKRTNQKLQFEGVSQSNPGRVIPFDFAPPLGDGDGFAGLELLLMSFSGCVSTAVVFLLERSGKHVSDYTAQIKGIRSEHPLTLREIHMNIRIESKDITETDLENVSKQAEAISPVWQAIKNNVAVKISFELI